MNTSVSANKATEAPTVGAVDMKLEVITAPVSDVERAKRIPLDVFRAGRKPMSTARNREETPNFAKSLERHALAHATDRRRDVARPV
jgi:hypothetical protein